MVIESSMSEMTKWSGQMAGTITWAKEKRKSVSSDASSRLSSMFSLSVR